MPATRILVFAKAPQPGLAKTRLIPVLGADGAAALARRMLARTLHAALAAEVGPVELCATPALEAPAWRGVSVPETVAISDQGEGDLGARMSRAAERTLARGEAALLVGTDWAEVSPALLHSAAARLAGADAFLHPCADGGYVLLGLARFHPRLFEDIPWSTGAVAAMTVARIRALGWMLEIGAEMHDVDEPADLEGLPFDTGEPGGRHFP